MKPIYESWKDNSRPDFFQPWPETGFLATYEADPPGETSINWHETRSDAIESLPAGARASLRRGEDYVDLTPEGSIGTYRVGVYAVHEAPRWVKNLPVYLGWDGATTAEQRAEGPV